MPSFSHRTISGLALGATLALAAVAPAQRPGSVVAVPDSGATYTVKEIESRMGLDQRLGDQVAEDAVLREDDGREVRLGAIIRNRPTILMPMFYRCQTACSLETDNLMKVLIKEETDNLVRRLAASENPGLAAEMARKDHMLVGKDVDVIFLSIHPKETSELAHARRVLVESAFEMGWEKLAPAEREAKMASMRKGFHFMTGTPEEVKKVTDSIGFRFFYNEPKDQMNHVAASVLLSPTGKIVTYFTGVEYATKVVAPAVVLAARDEVAPKGDTFMLGCIMVDPVTGKTTLLFNRIVMLGCFLTLGVLGVSIVVMNRRNPAHVRVSDILGTSPSNPDSRISDKGGDGAA